MNSKEIHFSCLSAREQCTRQLNLNRVIVCCYLNCLIKVFFFSLEVITSAEKLTVRHEKCALLTENGKKRSHPRIDF